MTVRAQDQLERLLLALPHITEDTEVPLTVLAEQVGTDVPTVLADLEALGTADRDVAGFVDAVELYLGPNAVSARTAFFRRPMRLTRSELAALDLGLGMLALERPMEERETIAAARAKVRQLGVVPPTTVVAGVPTQPEPSAPPAVAVEAVPDAARELFGVLWQAREERRAVRITYERATDRSRNDRVVHPWAIVRVHQHLYMIGWCTTVVDARVFRLDRVVSASLDGATYEIPAEFDVDTVVRDGRIFSGEAPAEELVVRYGAAIARWIAEREGVPIDADGSVTVRWPLADSEWAVRHVLQYGADAQVVAPDHVRAMVCERLEQLVAPGNQPR